VKRRRSLTHVGGAVEFWGDPDLASMLAHALAVPPATSAAGGDEARAHVHGFHTYPARMHPLTAARLVQGLTREGATVLDPFCGSGTVLVEAMIAGRRAVGVDLNPIAVRLARLKTTRLDARELEAFVELAQGVAQFAAARRERRAGATRRYPREDVELFDPHVLLELDSLRAGIASEKGVGPRVRDALELVLSAILVKVSRRASDTSTVMTNRRLAGGFTTRLFASKAQELARRLAEFAQLLPADAPAVRLDEDDAARLRSIAASTVDVVITSPPYAGTYDYLSHHAGRMRWLGLKIEPFATGEIGSRRRYAQLDAHAAQRAWARELGGALSAIRRVCRPGAQVVLLLADSAVRGQAIRAEATVASVAKNAAFDLVARASQTRPHFHGETAAAFRDAPRTEHAIVLQKS
jgi:DNA modification methylase